MLWVAVLILFALWSLGMVTSYALGGLLHLLLVIAILFAVISLSRGRAVA